MRLLLSLTVMCVAFTAQAEVYRCGDGVFRSANRAPASCEPLRSSTTCSNGNKYITPSRPGLPAVSDQCEPSGLVVSPFTHFGIRPALHIAKRASPSSFQLPELGLSGIQSQIESVVGNYQNIFDSLFSQGFNTGRRCN
ncbi:MAG: hypothetical protein QY326_08640 [Bdellovibrionota bacterium]|nr:MAG: hypothetical protein QY326_08640 [Bdellovibrionota bacterium]